MPDHPVISVTGVGKAYRMWESPSSRLTVPMMEAIAPVVPGGDRLRRRAARGYRDFWALRDIAFEVRKGEAVGIIGRNGSGKSTLLQVIAGTLQPTTGRVDVRGRVAALLELGSGFNPDFTGRENVQLSAAVLGLSRAEIDARFDDIAAFADIGEFIDQPVKTYSSGMMVRLAFAVNTCVDPDILMVDEALSVGDAPFQAKCFRRLRQLIDRGVSLLFVSHDIATVRSICSRALWLKQGRAEMWGEAKPVARGYEKYCWQEQGVVFDAPAESSASVPADAPNGSPAGPATDGAYFPPSLPSPTAAFLATRERSRYGTEGVRILNVLMTAPGGEVAAEFDYGAEATVWVLLETMQPVASECIVSFLFRDLRGNAVLASQDVTNRARLEAPRGQRFVARTTIPLPLHHQKYVLHTAVFGFQDGVAETGGKYDFGRAVLWDVIDEAYFLEVRPCPIMPLSGPVHLDRAVSITTIAPQPR